MKPETTRSRRSFLLQNILSAGTVSAALLATRETAGAGDREILSPAGAFENCSPAPVPIPGGFNARAALGPRYPDRTIHLFLPGPRSEPSTIFNFRGSVGILNIHGTGTRTLLDPDTGETLSQTPNLPFATDVRFMHGLHAGVDGKRHKGIFAFF